LRAIDIITKKRDAHPLSATEIEYFIQQYTCGDIPDYQASAWLMAVLLRGMTRAETAALTRAMLNSGEVFDFPAGSAAKVDKHSTGGVGDKTSLVLAPLAAAAGLVVPMISGRGLGHTGGTLDKLEAIPGFNVNLSVEQFRRVLEKCGCAMIGQTAEIAPADRKLYALRDVTATVESPYLICASIMSKKLAEGIDALVLDVKTGSGAFMQREEDAAFLAQLMVETGECMGTKVIALITDMDQPLGTHIGNSLEVIEALDILRGGGPADTRELCLDLAGWMLYLGGGGETPEQGKQRARELLHSGAALEKFRQMIALQGGDARLVEDSSLLPAAQHTAEVMASDSGFIAQMNCHAIGLASVILGGGRQKKEDSVDPSVGIVMHHKLGHKVSAGEPLCTIHYNSQARAEEAAVLLRRSFEIRQRAPERLQPLIHRVIGSNAKGD
jgi:pyrimidine-nucleoside phosphorylase